MGMSFEGSVDVVVVAGDDASEDDFDRAVESVQEQSGVGQVLVFRDEDIARAYNRGIASATSRYVAFLNAADYWKPEKLRRQLTVMQERGAGFSITAVEDENGDMMGDVQDGGVEEFIRKVFVGDILPQVSSMVIDTKRVTSRFDSVYPLEGRLFALKAAGEVGVACLDEPLVVRTDDAAEPIGPERAYLYSYKLRLSSHRRFLGNSLEVHPSLEGLKRRFWQNSYAQIGRDLYRQERYTKSAAMFLRSLYCWFPVPSKIGHVLNPFVRHVLYAIVRLLTWISPGPTYHRGEHPFLEGHPRWVQKLLLAYLDRYDSSINVTSSTPLFGKPPNVADPKLLTSDFDLEGSNEWVRDDAVDIFDTIEEWKAERRDGV